MKEFDGSHASASSVAIDDNLAVRIKFLRAFWKLRERNKVTANVTDLVLERFANVEQEWRVSSVEPFLQLFNADLELVDIDVFFQGGSFNGSKASTHRSTSRFP